MISREEVKHIADLARLGLEEKELEEYQKKISSILDYIEKLKEVDVSGVDPSSHVLDVKNAMREDIERENCSEETRKKLLSLAPETKEGYIKVKPIFN